MHGKIQIFCDKRFTGEGVDYPCFQLRLGFLPPIVQLSSLESHREAASPSLSLPDDSLAGVF